jgi:hypothetical protein
LKKFKQNLTIQTLFIKGHYKGKEFDNTSEKEISAWLEVLEDLQPDLVMVYTIDRDTPIETIEKIPETQLFQIARRVEQLGLSVTVST